MLARTMTVAATAARRIEPTNCRNASPTPPTISRDRSGQQAFQEWNYAGVNQIVPCSENHQRQHQRESHPEAVFLGALAERPAANRLSSIEQQMSTIEDRDREQIDEPKIDREHRHEPNEIARASLRHYARHLRDADGAAEFVGGPRAYHHLTDRAQRSRCHVPGLVDRAPERDHGVAPHELGTFAGYAEPANAVDIAEDILLLNDRRGCCERQLLAIPTHQHLHRLAGVEPDDLLNVLEALDGLAVDRYDGVL